MERTVVQTGAEILIQEKLSLLKGKRVALVTNHTGRVGDTHLVDTLLELKVKIQKLFVPEHGFRGEAEAGAGIQDGKDTRTGLPLISLYGDRKMPFPEDLEDVDILLYDIQDVGTRYDNYLSTLA